MYFTHISQLQPYVYLICTLHLPFLIPVLYLYNIMFYIYIYTHTHTHTYIHIYVCMCIWQPTPVFFPGESHGKRGLVGYDLWGCKESDTTEQLTHIHTHTYMPCLVTQLCPTLQHGLQPTRLLCLWDSPGKNTVVCSHYLFQGIFLIQGSNPGLLHCGQFFRV